MMIFDDIKDSNRNELLAIPFYGWIKNPVETMIRHLMKTGEIINWRNNRYDFLRAFPFDDPHKLFSLTMQYTINSFRLTMIESGKKYGITENQAEADFNYLITNANPRLSCITVMELMITKLLDESFVKGIYIYDPVMTADMKQYLLKTFTTHNDKIFAVEANIKDIIESENPIFTTVYVEDLDMYMDVLQSYGEEELKKYMSDTYYIMPAKSSLTDGAKQMSAAVGILPKDIDVYKYQKFLEGTLKQVNSMVDFLQLKAITLAKPNNGGNNNDNTRTDK